MLIWKKKKKEQAPTGALFPRKFLNWNQASSESDQRFAHYLLGFRRHILVKKRASYPLPLLLYTYAHGCTHARTHTCRTEDGTTGNMDENNLQRELRPMITTMTTGMGRRKPHSTGKPQKLQEETTGDFKIWKVISLRGKKKKKPETKDKNNKQENKIKRKNCIRQGTNSYIKRHVTQ